MSEHSVAILSSEGDVAGQGLLIHPNLVVLQGDLATRLASSPDADVSTYRVRFSDQSSTIVDAAELHLSDGEDPLVGITFRTRAPVQPLPLSALPGHGGSESAVRAYLRDPDPQTPSLGGNPDAEITICEIFRGAFFCATPGSHEGEAIYE